MERTHIIILGACNSGKSSIANMLTRQHTALVSDTAGTTTDPVRKTMELPHIGASMIIDTAGFDDITPLGEERIRLTKEALNSANVAILLVGENPTEEERWRSTLQERKIPFIEVANKSDLGRVAPQNAISVSTIIDQDKGRKELIEAILEKLPVGFGQRSLLAGMAKRGDVVMLVMPQDGSAPAGRLILPQVQTMRALLDIGAITIAVQPAEMPDALAAMKEPPALIITDSQVFKEVAPLVPKGSRLTSFSLLMAAFKGDIEYFAQSAKQIDNLTENSRILIAEACTHAPQSEDIGTVKIPAMLRKRFGAGLQIEHVAGRDFPEDLSPYDLVIQCGGCMFNRPYMLSRVERARSQGVAMTNYGITLAHLTGILQRVALPNHTE